MTRTTDAAALAASPHAGAPRANRRPGPSIARVLIVVFAACVLGFSMLPLFVVVPVSFSDTRFLTFPPPGFSLRWFESFLGNPNWIDAATTSLLIATLTAAIATPLGIAASYSICNSRHWSRSWLRGALMLPLMVPVIIVAVGVFFVFARFGLLNTITGLVLANVMLALPYVVTAVTAGLQGFDPMQEMVARSLGMNRLRAFMLVTLPQIKPSVFAGAVFAFIQALDETVVALFISGGSNQTLTKQMFTALRDEIDPTIAAISSLLTASTFMLVMLVGLSRKATARK